MSFSGATNSKVESPRVLTIGKRQVSTSPIWVMFLQIDMLSYYAGNFWD
jgi:hypothetical protein